MELACASKCFVWADLLDRRMGRGGGYGAIKAILGGEIVAKIGIKSNVEKEEGSFYIEFIIKGVFFELDISRREER